VNEVQQGLLGSMKDVLSRFENNGLELGVLVTTLRGLYESADIQDPELRTSFEVAWVSLDHEHELRTESWASPGASTPESLARSVASFRSWIDSALKQ
jgi:hypothetical protein